MTHHYDQGETIAEDRKPQYCREHEYAGDTYEYHDQPMYSCDRPLNHKGPHFARGYGNPWAVWGYEVEIEELFKKAGLIDA